MLVEEQLDIHRGIKDFIEKTFMANFENGSLSETDNLFQKGVIDSFGLIELITFLEKTFSIHISDEDLFSSKLTTLNDMVVFVNSKMVNQT